MSSGGYLSGNMLVSFPFEDGRKWRGGDADRALDRCFADAMVCLSGRGFPGWPEVGEISSCGDSLSFSIRVGGASVRVSAKASPVDEFPVVRGSAEWGSYVMSLSSSGIRELCEFLAPSSTDSTSSSSGEDGGPWLRLCARCVRFRPEGLESLSVFDGTSPFEDGPHFVLSGDVKVVPGNNMEIAADGLGGMSLDAVPGAGAGMAPCVCPEESIPTSELAGPTGHVRLFNDTCYDLEPGPFGTVVVDGEERLSRSLLVHAKCTACCTCEMYESIVNDRLAPLGEKVRNARREIRRMRSEYEEGVKIFNRRISVPALDDVGMSITGMPSGTRLGSRLEGTDVRGRMDRCAFSAVVRNSSYSEMYVTIAELEATDYIAEATAAWTDRDGSPLSSTSESASGMVGSTFTVFPGMSLVVSFVAAKRAMVSSAGGSGFFGRMSVTVRYRTRSGRTGSLGTITREVNV